PQSGPLLLYAEPRVPGLRVDSGFGEGDDVPVHYDPLIAKVVAKAESRPAAIARLIAALRRYPILGVRTNITFLIGVLEHPRFREGTIDTAFLDGESNALEDDGSQQIPAFVQAAIEAHERMQSPAGGRSRSAPDPWTTVKGF